MGGKRESQDFRNNMTALSAGISSIEQVRVECLAQGHSDEMVIRGRAPGSSSPTCVYQETEWAKTLLAQSVCFGWKVTRFSGGQRCGCHFVFSIDPSRSEADRRWSCAVCRRPAVPLSTPPPWNGTQSGRRRHLVVEETFLHREICQLRGFKSQPSFFFFSLSTPSGGRIK